MEENKKLKIVVFPWLAFGHMIPFLELSKALARRGHVVYFVSTPINIQRLRSKVSDDVSDLIQFVPLHLPKVSGLPHDAESTLDVPQSKVDYLKIAFDGLQHPFSNFIRDLNPKPDYILQDFAQHWIPHIATEAKVPSIYFNIFTVTFSLFLGPPDHEDSENSGPEQLTVPPPWIPFPSNIRFRLYEARRLFTDSFTTNKSGITDIARFRLVLQGCSAVAVRGCTELEPDCFRVYPQICGKPVLPVGLLPPPELAVANHEGEIVQWLNSKRPRSVLFIAFGSETAFSKQVVKEIADGVEEARVPFMWACREELPAGFEERTKGYGMVARGWVQQTEVLGHGSVGGVLMHCGWGSVVESLRFGLPLVAITVFSDQGMNARIMVRGGYGVEVERDEGDGSFTKEDVKRAVRFVMVEEEGECVREKAREMKRMLFSNVQIHNVYVDKFVGFLQNGPLSKVK